MIFKATMNKTLHFKVICQSTLAQVYYWFDKKTTKPPKVTISDSGSIIIYAATIGELNAARFLIEKIKNQWPDKQVVLLSGQYHYLSDYKKNYPDLNVLCTIDFSPCQLNKLFKQLRPEFVFFIEGPSLHGRFPIRLNLNLPVQCLKDKVPLYVVNACLYKDYIASTIDRLEHKLFADLHKQAVTQWFVANPQFAKSLRNENIPADRITVSGDIKFDAIFLSDLKAPDVELQEIIKHFKNSYPLIVAGSVKAPEEYQAIIYGWLELKNKYPQAQLILAPRYVQEEKMMQAIYHFLDKEGISYSRRSSGIEHISKCELMVVDTFGELNYFYQLATLAFAGRNHGVLEPMRFNKPVLVGPEKGWDAGYPTSYYLYREMLEKKALIQIDNYSDVGSVFISLLDNPTLIEKQVNFANLAIEDQSGAVEKITTQVNK